MRTDDPGTPGSGNWEVNIAATANGRPEERVYEAPHLDFNFGLGERVQLKFEIPWVIRDADTETTKSGLGNSLLGMKWRFYESKIHELGISTYPQLEFNNPNRSADRGLVERGMQFLVPIEVTKKVGPIDLTGEAGYRIRQYGSDEWLTGLVAGRQVSSRLELLGEIFATAKVNGEEHDDTIDAGGRFKLREHLLLLFMAGHSFHDTGIEGSQFVGYLGMQFLLPTSKRSRNTTTLGSQPR